MKTLLVAERFNEHSPKFTRRWFDAWNEVVVHPSVPPLYFAVMRDLGTFRSGRGAKILSSIGLRWDASMNLMWPSCVSGDWDARTAARIAAGLEPLMRGEYDRIIYAGKRVATAFMGVAARQSPGVVDERTFIVPHPSGRSRFWNDHRAVALLTLELKGWQDA